MASYNYYEMGMGNGNGAASMPLYPGVFDTISPFRGGGGMAVERGGLTSEGAQHSKTDNETELEKEAGNNSGKV